MPDESILVRRTNLTPDGPVRAVYEVLRRGDVCYLAWSSSLDGQPSSHQQSEKCGQRAKHAGQTAEDARGGPQVFEDQAVPVARRAAGLLFGRHPVDGKWIRG